MFTEPCISDSVFQPRSLRLNTHVPVHSAKVCMRHASDNQRRFFHTEKLTPLHDALLLAHESRNLLRREVARCVLGRWGVALWGARKAGAGDLWLLANDDGYR